MSEGSRFDVLVIGGGPAALALVSRAVRDGRLPALTRRGIAVVDPGGRLGSGTLGSVVVDSDTDADVFSEVLEDVVPPGVADDELAALRRHRGAAVSLPIAARALDAVGIQLSELLASGPRSTVIAGSVTELRTSETHFEALVHLAGSSTCARLLATTVVLATGGVPAPAGASLSAAYGPTIHAHDVLTGTVMPPCASRGVGPANVVIVGGSHSSFAAAAWLLRTGDPHHRWPAGTIEIHHRGPVRPWYASTEAAIADGYESFTSRDVCAQTGRIHRMGGLRSAARSLFLAVSDIGDRRREHRVRLVPLTDADAASVAPALTLTALGYARRIPRLAVDGEQLAEVGTDERSLVDSSGRVLHRDGTVIDGLYAIGMAAGWRRSAATGGEASFGGEINGLWAYQNLMAPTILDAVGTRT